MTVNEAVAKYGENEADVITFAMFLLMTSKLSIDPSEIDTYVGLVQNIFGAPYALYFLETVTHTEDITMFTNWYNKSVSSDVVTSENISLIITLLKPIINDASTITESIIGMIDKNPNINDVITHTEVVTVTEV